MLSRVDRAVAAEEGRPSRRGRGSSCTTAPCCWRRIAGLDYAAVVAVLARWEDRIHRVVRDRGKDRAYVESIMAAQVTDLERIRRADRLVLNTTDRGTLAAALRGTL